MIEWSDELSIGVDAIDDQHCAFVGLVNRFSALNRSGASNEAMRSILADVVSYAEIHFIDEEDLMRRAGYPELAEHMKAHDAAAAKIHDMLIRDADGPELYGFLASFLKTWLLTHIMSSDKAFGDWLKANHPEAPAVPVR